MGRGIRIEPPVQFEVESTTMEQGGTDDDVEEMETFFDESGSMCMIARKHVEEMYEAVENLYEKRIFPSFEAVMLSLSELGFPSEFLPFIADLYRYQDHAYYFDGRSGLRDGILLRIEPFGFEGFNRPQRRRSI